MYPTKNFFAYKMLFCLTWLGACVMGSNTSTAQNILGYNYKDIAVQVNDETSEFYYPTLVKRFETLPTNWQLKESIYLYYGYSTLWAYNPYKHKKLEDSLFLLTENELFYKAEVLADSLLRINPVSLFGNVGKGTTALVRKDTLTAGLYFNRYNALLGAIFASGDGSSYEKAMLIITPKDAEAVLFRYKLKSLGKSFNGYKGSYFDVYMVQSQDGKREFPLYFNTSIPYQVGLPKMRENK